MCVDIVSIRKFRFTEIKVGLALNIEGALKNKYEKTPYSTVVWVCFAVITQFTNCTLLSHKM